ncbi:transmembrane protein, putative (macronuclear) [Tetrahymena thermophila SB210]|uniref:Transmembrane protein, putative n=1 Tax=Tetrahymena thermophila (strain SB210) TaxID=312017 RepID=W7XEH1_TETTS|nr:transmembrane protein, putative [Tetrahymena thermophila SB210]EWS76092.1 transmembrane protein, putative [Tetrahymena thermophila SB210]|eukprot:XP_012651399.1 transmembrane protein, putative [Tetrahymena thermophila SB210]
MRVFAYLIGYQYKDCYSTQSIVLQKSTANQGSFTFEFFTTNSDNPLVNSGNQQKQSTYQLETNKNISFIMIGLTGYILGQKSNTVNLELSQSQNSLPTNIILIYSKQGDPIVYGYTSSILFFQMKQCDNNKINFNDTCVDQCPSGYFQLSDSQRQILTCQICDISCKTCDKATECLTCNDNYPYYLSDKKICKQDYPTKYVCSEQKPDYLIAKQNCVKCDNCLDCNSLQSCCNYNDINSYIQFSNNNCECKDKLTMTIDLQKQKCSCNDLTKMKINDQQNSCICQDSQTMILNLDKSSCDCKDTTTMKFYQNKCVCLDEINMIFQEDKCDCMPSMFFNVTSSKCECRDKNVMQYVLSQKGCDCPQNSILVNDKCICQDRSYYMDQYLKKCIQNPQIANCEIPNEQLPQCLKCYQGYKLVNGICKFCGNGKFFDDVTNDCTQSCIQYCYFCSNKQDCKQYEDQFPCHFSCQICTIPNSSTACSLCSSPTRQFNLTDSSCNCIYGYEETGQIDCQAIQQSYSQSFLTLKTVLHNLSFYMQLVLAITPFFPYIQYSFILQQQIGLISEILPDDIQDLRIELLNEYNNYNFKFFAFMFITASRLLSTQVTFSVIWVFLQLDQLNSNVKALTAASVDSLIIIFFIVSLIYHCKEVFKYFQLQKQSSHISTDTKHMLNESINFQKSSSNNFLIRDINLNQGSVNQNSQTVELETGKQYKNPSILDITTIAIILIFQSFTIISALVVIYLKIKAIIIRLSCSRTNKSKIQDDDYMKGTFPQNMDISIIDQILSSNNKFTQKFVQYRKN